MVELFHTTSEKCSRIVTEGYSTSFASAIGMLHKDLRKPIYNIYGFVRFADEIVDSFHDFDKQYLLQQFKMETYDAIERKISLNPILNSFQQTVNAFQIDTKLIDSFFESMEMDLEKKKYDRKGYQEYIYGSAEVVGLMWLYIFCEGKTELYDKQKSTSHSSEPPCQTVNSLLTI